MNVSNHSNYTNQITGHVFNFNVQQCQQNKNSSADVLLSQVTWGISSIVFIFKLTWILQSDKQSFRLLFTFFACEDGSNTFFRNIDKILTDFATLRTANIAKECI